MVDGHAITVEYIFPLGTCTYIFVALFYFLSVFCAYGMCCIIDGSSKASILIRINYTMYFFNF